MPPLRNIKHEKLAQIIATKTVSNTQAYKEVYPQVKTESARASVSETLAKANVKDRIYELLEKRKAGLDRVSSRLKDHLESETENISLDTCKTILKIYGAFDEQDASKNMTKINIRIHKIENNNTTSPQVIDVTEVKDNE